MTTQEWSNEVPKVVGRYRVKTCEGHIKEFEVDVFKRFFLFGQLMVRVADCQFFGSHKIKEADGVIEWQGPTLPKD